MNKRLFLLIGGLFGVALLIVAAVLLMGGNRTTEPEPSATPEGSVVLPNGQVVDEDEYQDSLAEEPDGPRDSNGALIQTDPHSDDGQLHTDDDGHDHGELTPGCVDGPVSTGCEGEDWTEMPSREAIAVGQEAVRAFTAQWIVIDTEAETADARETRLKAAGATNAVAEQVSVITRPKTALLNLRTVSKGNGQNFVSFTSNRDGVYQYAVSITVIANYSLNGNQNQKYTTSGTMLVDWDSKTNTIVSVEENFRDLLGLT